MASKAEQTEFSFTVEAARMITALKGVAQFASTDSTLPVICGVLAELADGELTLAATDRYTIAYQQVKTDKAEGAGRLLLPNAIVKAFISQATDAKYDIWTFTVEADSWTVETLAGGKQTRPIDGSEFPRWRKLVDGFKPAPASKRVGSVTFSPTLLAKFAKVPYADTGVRFTFAAPGKPAKFTVGDVTGLIMPILDAS